MRAPEFWFRPCPTPAATLLAPLGWLWEGAGTLRRLLAHPQRAPVPVVCVGNLVVGGAGKTPTALALARRLRARGLRPHFLTRGYGGREKGPLRVDPDRHDAAAVGDEALLLARLAPTWVAAERPAGALAAAKAGAEAIVMDDGFQNPSLVQDLALVVVDGAVGFGNGLVMPAGPLREPARDGLARASAVILLGADATRLAPRLAAADGAPPVLRAHLRPGPEAGALVGRKVVAFAGIGRPDKFFDTLRDVGCHLVAGLPFPDHHPFTDAEIADLAAEAKAAGALLVTTEKDAARLTERQRTAVEVLTITLDWEDEAAVDQLLEPILARR